MRSLLEVWPADFTPLSKAVISSQCLTMARWRWSGWAVHNDNAPASRGLGQEHPWIARSFERMGTACDTRAWSYNSAAASARAPPCVGGTETLAGARGATAQAFVPGQRPAP